MLAKNSFEEQALVAINTYRLHHETREVRWSDELALMAQEWAKQIADRGYLQYSEHVGLGENITIFEQDGIEVSGESIGKQWYDECQNYNFDNPCWQKGTSNFTQIVWRGSTEVGVAMVRMKRSDTKAVAVAFFRPPGNTNFHGNYRDNVLPPQPCAEL